MISDGQNGFLYAIEPMYQLNQVISKFEQISLAEKEIISKAAYNQYIKNYTLEKHIKAIHQLYQFESGI
jgi:hypothetical protein